MEVLIVSVEEDSLHFQVIGRTAIPFLIKIVVPGEKRAGADLSKIVAPETSEVFAGRNSFNSAAKNVRRQTLRKHLGIG